MMKGTSPAVTALPGGGYQIAFQANTGALWTTGTAGTVNTNQGMMQGTSPGIAASSNGGYQVAFQANNGSLYTYSSTSGPANLSLGMLAGTSPAIAALTNGGYQMAFQANTGSLWTIGSAGNANMSLGMMRGTSPAITALPSGGYEIAFQANTGALWAVGTAGNVNTNQGMMSTTSPSIAAPASAGADLVFSQYKEISTGGIAGSGAMQTRINGSLQSQVSAMPARNTTLTWAFAAGACGSETWDGFSGSAIASANVQAFVNAGKNYIISTGGSGQKFTCTSDAGFTSFIQRYYSANMIGVDFDIEYTQTAAEIDSLVQRVVNVQGAYPNLRYSFTIATLGGNRANSLNSLGASVMQSIKNRGLKNYTINLMVMDYGSNSAGNCTLNGSGLCNMGASANQAAVNLHNYYGTPYNQIELTPLIGENDSTDEIFTIADANAVASFVKQNGLVGVHFWAFDRDADCAFNPSGSPSNCNGVGNAGRLGYTNTFINALGL